jgi:hypothetical protein
MSQPTFKPSFSINQESWVQNVTGSAVADSLTLMPPAATRAGNMLLIGISLNPTAPKSEAAEQLLSGITIMDSAGSRDGRPVEVPVMKSLVEHRAEFREIPFVNEWKFLGDFPGGGITTSWWVCYGAASITSLTINVFGTCATELPMIVGIMLEHRGARGPLPFRRGMPGGHN